MFGYSASEYGNPEKSLLTDVGQKGYEKLTSRISAGVGAVSGAISGIAGIYGAFAQADANNKTIDQLKYELRRNKEKMLYDWKKSDAENQLSLWASGQTMGGGSSAQGVLDSNKNIVESNIEDMERAVNAEIDNLRTQSRNQIIGSIISGVGSIVTGGISGLGG